MSRRDQMAQPAAHDLDADAAPQDEVAVDAAFRRAALVQDSKLSVRKRRLHAQRRQGTH